MKKAPLCIAALFACTTILAQSGSGKTWSQNTAMHAQAKPVHRTIDMSAPENTGNSYSDGSSLPALLINAVKTGRLAAYSKEDDQMNMRLPAADALAIISHLTDSTLTTDPATGKQKSAEINRNYSALHLLKLSEHWIYDQRTGITKIETMGIALLADIKNPAGELLGARTLFWLRYSDVKAIIAVYNAAHPSNTLASHIWDGLINK